MPEGHPFTLPQWTRHLNEIYVAHEGAGALSEQDAADWAHAFAGQDRAVVEGWLKVGARRASEVPRGLSRDDLLRLTDVQVVNWEDPFRGLDPGWAGVAPLCPTLTREAISTHRRPREVVALLGALHPLAREEASGFGSTTRHHRESLIVDCEWSAPEVRVARDVMNLLSEVDWVDAALCLRAGMSAVEAREYVRSGGDMEPVRVMAGLMP